jgi:hypothetical protein
MFMNGVGTVVYLSHKDDVMQTTPLWAPEFAVVTRQHPDVLLHSKTRDELPYYPMHYVSASSHNNVKRVYTVQEQRPILTWWSLCRL